MSDSAQAPELRELEPIENPKEVLQHLTMGAKLLASTMLWTKGQTKITRTHLTVLSQVDQAFYTWAPKDFEIKKFTDDLVKINNECILGVSLPSAQIFFKTQFITLDSAGLKFKIPTAIQKIQRRENFRFKIPDTYSLKIEYQDPLFPDVTQSKKAIDISSGGLSFATGEEDKAVYQPGLFLNNMKFTIHRGQIQTTAEVRHSKSVSEPGQESKLKVGVSFKDLSSADKDLIASYVLDESTKYLGKLLY